MVQNRAVYIYIYSYSYMYNVYTNTYGYIYIYIFTFTYNGGPVLETAVGRVPGCIKSTISTINGGKVLGI